ncbi:hypothetical protein GCM10023093_20990 [Nemorincola caseinilytica]|uniref:Guanylate cyclase domain-containing protein n=1 Tax=Nemorincola caseinilytica TaxID=2054315 RepID=A0ABP8NG13_9BACT
MLFLLVLSFCTGRSHAQGVVVVSPHGGLADVSRLSAIFLDKEGQVDAADIAAGRVTDKFKYTGKSVVNYGITMGTSWNSFRLTNTGTDRIYISIHDPMADTVRLYKVKNGHAILIGMGGNYMPIAERQVRTEDILLDLGAGPDTTTYLLSIRNSRNHVYSLNAGSLTDHIHVINHTSLLNIGFIGFALLLALYHLFLFFSIRNLPYLYYTGYVVSYGLFMAHLNGSAFLYLWPSHPEWNHYDIIFSAAIGFFSTLFTISFLDLRKHAPQYCTVAWVMAWLYVVVAIATLLGFSFAAFIFIQCIIPFGLVYTIVASLATLRKGYKPARFFLTAWSVIGLGVVIFILNNLNVIEYNFFTEHSMQIAALIECLVLSFALADRFNNYKKEKEVLMRTQNEMLEQKVAERTDELRKQQHETEQLLLNILPEEVAAELKQKGAARSRNYGSVTVLFTDFKDFTRIVESISPEQLISDLNYCFSAFDKIIEKYGIEKIKTIGDSYMCAGGFGTAVPASALNVVRAGIEIRDFMEQRNREEKARGGNVFEVRIGIHTGPVIAGIIGIKKFAYDIWGDTVNIASRMESAGETGKVNISGITYEMVKDDFRCTYRGKMPAKNKGEIDMYFAERKNGEM